MMTKEEYQKTLIRMWDSLRENDEDMGKSNCEGVRCCKCPLYLNHNMCQLKVYNACEIISIVEEWGKEHPIKTNREVFTEAIQEKFGDIFNIPNLMRRLENTCQIYIEKCDGDCSECGQKTFWDKEYKEVTDADSN